jgi:hypothetical protein
MSVDRPDTDIAAGIALVCAGRRAVVRPRQATAIGK